jgi:hypothetical protein
VFDSRIIKKDFQLEKKGKRKREREIELEKKESVVLTERIFNKRKIECTGYYFSSY